MWKSTSLKELNIANQRFPPKFLLKTVFHFSVKSWYHSFNWVKIIMTKHFTFRQHCFISDDHKVLSVLRNHHRRQNYTHCTRWWYFRSVLCIHIYKLCTLVHVSVIFCGHRKDCRCWVPVAVLTSTVLTCIHVYMAWSLSFTEAELSCSGLAHTQCSLGCWLNLTPFLN